MTVRPKLASSLGSARTARVVAAITAVMKTIEEEIDAAGGLYPYNHGRLTMAEVCRRADVHPITMMGPAHKTSTRLMILDWIKRLQSKMVVGARTVRKTVTARADDWETQYKLIAAKYKQMYSIEIIQRDSTIDQLKRRVAVLEAENLQLQEQLSQGRVVRLHKPSAK